MLEIEFYFTCENMNDPFTHGDETQQTCGNFYFHRTNGRLRTGNYKGVDISIGNSSSEYGGILVRSIEQLGFNPKVVCGPSKVVDHILHTCEMKEVQSLVDKMTDLSVKKGEEEKLMYLSPASEVQVEQLHQFRVFSSARVGLFMTKTEAEISMQEDFVFEEFRFFVNPKSLWKGKHLMAISLHLQGKSLMEIESLLGAKLASVKKHLHHFEEGKKIKVKHFHGRRLEGEELICKCYGSVYNHNKQKKL